VVQAEISQQIFGCHEISIPASQVMNPKDGGEPFSLEADNCEVKYLNN